MKIRYPTPFFHSLALRKNHKRASGLLENIHTACYSCLCSYEHQAPFLEQTLNQRCKFTTLVNRLGIHLISLVVHEMFYIRLVYLLMLIQ